MSRRALATRATTPAAPQIVYYPQPANPPAAVSPWHPSQVARRREYALAIRQWEARQAAIREHDRKVRHFLLGLGAVVGLAVVTAFAVGAWIVYHAATHAGSWIGTHAALVLVGAVIGVVGLAVGGHRCVTTVIHRH